MAVECKKCHATAQFKDVKTECQACHEKDDVHKRRLGLQCESCHNARSWSLWDFNHTTRTRFRLEGGHKGLDCYSCHRKPVTGKAVLSMTCVSCHDQDDVHEGAFGRQCDKCHGVDSFKQIKSRVGASCSDETNTASGIACSTMVRGLCRDMQTPGRAVQTLLATRGEAR